jgi:hypothetical protein
MGSRKKINLAKVFVAQKILFYFNHYEVHGLVHLSVFRLCANLALTSICGRSSETTSNTENFCIV